MNRTFLLIYLLFFISVNAMAALDSAECAHALISEPTNNSTHQMVCDKLENQTNNVENGIENSDKYTNGKFGGLSLNDKEPTSGALTFILLIPALLVFIFSGFKKSSK